MEEDKGTIRLDDLVKTHAKEQEEKDLEITYLRKVITDFSKERRRYVVEQDKYKNAVLFGLTGDLHMGSLYERVDAYAQFLKVCRSEGVTHVYNAGDLLDGVNMYKGQIYEQYAHGYTAQLSAFSKKVPRVRDIENYFITGNHDQSFKKSAGIRVGEGIQAERDDFHFLGEDYADIIIRAKSGRSIRLALMHPDGGTPYAISYRTQKIIEALSGGQKPQIIGIGHLHKSEHLPNYRNVDGVMVGCFQSQTPYMRRKPTPAHVGGWIFEVTLGKPKDLSMRIKGEFISFYEPEDVEQSK